jgi:exonuclease VII small subunit
VARLTYTDPSPTPRDTRQSEMHNGNFPTTLRRSSRIPTSVAILVSTADGKQFSECQTLVVNAHGCAMLSRVKFESGAPLRLHNREGRKTTARVVSCEPVGPDNGSWRLGAMLERPENFWGLKDCPKDWALPTGFVSFRAPRTASLPSTSLAPQVPVQVSAATEAVLSRIVQQLEVQVETMIAESVRPLQTEITALKEKLERRDVKPSRFEVSLSSIPPELEQQMELRLRKALGPRVLDEAQQQSAQVLAAAKAAIEKRTTDGYEDFLHRVAEELKVVEKRAQEISVHISDSSHEHLRRGLEDFQHKVLEGGNSLKRLTEELLEFVRNSLNDEQNARRGDLEELRASVSSESSRLHEHIEHLDRRIARLDESSSCLESGLTQRLSQMASNTISEARTQLEGMSNDMLEELTARSITALGNQLDDATGNMKIVQKGIIASLSESLQVQASDALQNFEHSMEELAQRAIEGWRLKLESGLTAVMKSIGEQFQLPAESSDEASQR